MLCSSAHVVWVQVQAYDHAGAVDCGIWLLHCDSQRISVPVYLNRVGVVVVRVGVVSVLCAVVVLGAFLLALLVRVVGIVVAVVVAS